MWKKMTAVALAVCMLCTLIVPAFGASGKLTYDSVVFLGDSISQGFTMKNPINNSYDYYDHLLSQESDYIKSVAGQEDVPEGSPYVNAYPYEFAKLAGTNLNYAYNYGIAGGMADDISVLLSADISTIEGTLGKNEEGEDEWIGGSAFADIGTMNALRADFAKAIGRDQALHNFVGELRTNIKNSDLVAVSTGGNDIYQNFLLGYQLPQNMEQLGEMGMLGLLVNIVSILMQFEQPWEDIIELLTNLDKLGEWLGWEDTSAPTENGAAASNDEGGEDEESGESGMDLSSLISLDAVKQLAEYFSKEDIYNFFNETKDGYEKSVLQDWKDAYAEIVAAISRMNPNADIALISQYNPFGIQNYIEFLKQQWEKGEFLKDVKLDAYTAARVVRTLLSALTEAQQNQGDANKVNEILAKVLAAVLDEVLPTIGEQKEVYSYKYQKPGKSLKEGTTTLTKTEFLKKNDIDLGEVEEWLWKDTGKTRLTFADEDNEALYELVQDLCYPVMTLMVGTGLQPVYDEMNAYLQKLAMKYSKATYVDITGAPASGRLDPHPGADQHKWIAERIYDELSEAVNSPLYNSPISKIIEAASKTSNFIRTLLHIPGQSLVDQVIDGVQEITAKVQSIMAIPKLINSILFPFLPQ